MFCGAVCTANTTNSIPSDKHLVEVTFADDDLPTNQMFHIVITLWMSEKSRGMDRWVYDWVDQGSAGPCRDADAKAKKCEDLLKTQKEPNHLLASPNQVVTVKCFYGGKTLIKNFPIDEVPSEVHQVLSVMGFRDSEFGRLKFIEKHSATAPQPTPPSKNP